MKVRIKKTLLKESNFDDGMETYNVDSVYELYSLEYSDYEENRKMIALQIDRNILTPAIQMQTKTTQSSSRDEERETIEKFDFKKVPKELGYLTRERDVVKKGRKVPYLYYAYKEISDGKIMNEENVSAVLQMQLEKAKLFKKNLRVHGGGASISLFLCDFGYISTHNKKWSEEYEKRARELYTARTYRRMGMQKGYDRGAFQGGKGTFPMPMSTVPIGKGTKPLYAQNVDFMYKTSIEPNAKINPDHLWAFKLELPLAMAYFMIVYNTESLSVSLSEAPELVVKAGQHWALNLETYTREYAKAMENEFEDIPTDKQGNFFDDEVMYAYTAAKGLTKDFIKFPPLSYQDFNSNYVENITSVEKAKSKKYKIPDDKKHPILRFKEKDNFWLTMIQPPPIELIDEKGQYGLPGSPHPNLDDIADLLDKSSEQIKKQSMNIAEQFHGEEVNDNYFKNLQLLLDIPRHFDEFIATASDLIDNTRNEQRKEELRQKVEVMMQDYREIAETINNNAKWMLESINLYYINKGGR